MNTIIERITEAIKDILIGLIKSSLDNMFTSVNEQVGTIAGQVGQTPQGWNAGIFNLIQNISQAIELYKSRDASEKLFRSDKSYLGNKSMRVYSDEALSLKVFIQFIALILRSRIY